MSSDPHPLAGIAGIFYAGLATVACIAGYLTAVAAVSALVRWWRGGARRLDKVQRLADLDNERRTPVTRPFTLGDHVIEVRPAATGSPRRPSDCRFCAPFWDATAPCLCGAIPCDDPGCGALAWQAVANTEELER